VKGSWFSLSSQNPYPPPEGAGGGKKEKKGKKESYKLRVTREE